LQHLYAQIINDEAGRTLVQASTVEPALREEIRGANIAAAEQLGSVLAERAKEAGISSVVFDRGGHVYHGVVKAFAEACRKGGLQF
jgi:large subunit ribosomal protein L18